MPCPAQAGTVEIADLQGLPNREPDKFGPWLKDRPHGTVAWAWHCKHERTGEEATVEVHFSDSLEYGSQLSDAVAANPPLVVLGAERLIDSNRLLLHPNQEWREAPAGQFQFWVARADLSITQATLIDEQLLRADVHAMASLVEAAEASSTRLDLRRDNVSALADGGIYLRRPGLAGDVPASQESAFNFFRTLPLDPQAAELVSAATSFAHLRSLVGDMGAAAPKATVRHQTDASTVVVPSPQSSPPTVIQTSRDPQSLESPSTPARAAESQKSAPARNRLPLYAGGIAAVAGIAVAFVLFSGGGDGAGSSVEPTTTVGEVATGIVAQATAASTPAVIVPTQPPAPVLPTRAEVMQALDNSTQVYIAAFRTGDIALLSTVFSGEALAYYQVEMNKMLASSQRQDNAILQTDYLDIQISSPTRAIVRTRERWSYRVVGQTSATQYNYNEYYEMDKTPQGWRVSVNTFERIP